MGLARALALGGLLLLLPTASAPPPEACAGTEGQCSEGGLGDDDDHALLQSGRPSRHAVAAGARGTGGSARSLALLRAGDRASLNQTVRELLQLAKGDPDTYDISEAGLVTMTNCVMTCLNFLSSDRERECDECTAKLLHGARSTAVGVNSVAVGYVADMLSIPIAGTYAKAWCDGDVGNCSVKHNFPGPNTTSIMGWDAVSAMVAEYPAKEWSGEWWRGNELGYIINNPFFWSSNDVDPLSIVLGARPAQHAAIRPLMEEMFTLGPKDSARYTEVQGIVTNYIAEFLSRRQRKGLKVPDDIKALVHQILNKVVFDRAITFSDAEKFVKVQSEVVALGTVSQVLPSLLYKVMGPIRTSVAEYATEYEELIKERWGASLSNEDCSPSNSCTHQAASMVWDAFYSAGGLSVPTTISTGVGLLFSSDESNPFPDASLSQDQALEFYWENIRYFPPVVGFPHWETRPTCAGSTSEATAALNKSDGGTEACTLGKRNSWTGYPEVNQYQGGVRVVPNLALAQADPKKWGPDADKFVIRPLAEYSKSLGFAEPAVNNAVAGGKMNRICPGKDLALMIGATFFQQFQKKDWAKSYDDITFGSGPTFVSSFTLSSKQMVEDCKEICPSCGVSPTCYAQLAKCEANKQHCKLCQDCEDDPPAWWDLVKKAACLVC